MKRGSAHNSSEFAMPSRANREIARACAAKHGE